MNYIEHQLRIYNPTGQLLTILFDGSFIDLSYTLKENEPGILELVLPGDFDTSLITIDSLIEVYRSYGPNAFRLEGDTAFFVRRIGKPTFEDGVKVRKIRAYSAISLLSRRIIPFVAGSSYTEKIDIPWDDMLKEIVYENYGPGASYAGASYGDDPARDLEPWLVVEPFFHYGASFPTTHSFPWKIVLTTLKDIVDEVRSNGIYCTFDVIRVGPAQFEFRVFLGPRGVDHSADSANPVIVSLERGNLTTPDIDENWEEEHNFIYAAGQGQETDRIVRTAKDDTRIGISPFNRQEFLEDARNVYLPESVQTEADAALEANRPIKTFTGAILQTEGSLYGVHWGWGDIVTAEYESQSFECRVNSISVSINAEGTEIVQGNLRAVNDVE